MNAVELLEVFVSLSLQVAVLVSLAFTLARFSTNEYLTSRIWSGCHFLVVCLAFRAFLLPRWQLLQPWPVMQSVTAVQIAQLQQTIGRVVAIAWAVGAVFSFSMFVLGWCGVYRFLKSCRPLAAHECPDVFPGETNLPYESQSVPQFLVSGQLRSPLCWQIHRPLIILPEYMLNFESEELRLIVRHEVEHLRTGHPLALFVQRLVEVVFWFHPFIWWSTRQAALARECACDAAAVQSRRDVANYLRSLLKVIESAEDETEFHSLELAFGRSPGMIALRSARLVDLAHRRTDTTATTRRPLGLLLAIGAVFVAVFLWAPVSIFNASRGSWSPWPTWSAKALHTFGISARDFDADDHRLEFDDDEH